ncbi:MAG: hypothetical protein PHV06_09040, partial [bacterium]|nr:hypothetical protein [bacterium]
LEEKQIDFSDQYPKSFSELPEIVFDLVIILCQDEINCPLFSGEFKHKLYFPLEDIGQISDDKKAVKVIDDIVNLIDDIIRLFIEDEIVYYTCPVCKLHYENEEDKNECEKWCRTHNNKQNLKIISKSREAKRNFRVF